MHLITPSLLVATPQLVDPNFKNAVILLVESHSEGALGFVLNRPASLPLRSLIHNSDLDIPSFITAWLGGPVGLDHGMVLYHSAAEEEHGTTTENNICLATSELALQRLVETAIQNQRSPQNQTAFLYPFRFLVGYAGWGAGQLNSEIRQGAWLELPLNEELLFNTPWQNLWDMAMAHVGVNPMGLITPAQPFLN